MFNTHPFVYIFIWYNKTHVILYTFYVCIKILSKYEKNCDSVVFIRSHTAQILGPCCIKLAKVVDFCMKRQWTTKRTLTLLCENRKYCLPFCYSRRRTNVYGRRIIVIIIVLKIFFRHIVPATVYVLEFLVLFRENMAYTTHRKTKEALPQKMIAFIFIVLSSSWSKTGCCSPYTNSMGFFQLHHSRTFHG